MSENDTVSIMVSEKTLMSRLEEVRAFVEKELQRINGEITQSRDSIRNLGLLNKKTVDEIKGIYQEQVETVIRESKNRFEAEEAKLQELIDKISITTLSRYLAAKAERAKKSADVFLRWFYFVAVCAFIFGVTVVWLTWGSLDSDQNFWAILKLMSLRFLVYVPVYFPLVWVLMHLNRWAVKKNRLAEEYDHKRVVAETYIGVSSQVEDLVRKGVQSAPALLERLVGNTIDVVCSNPSDKVECTKTLTPVDTAVENLTKVVNSAVDAIKLSQDK